MGIRSSMFGKTLTISLLLVYTVFGDDQCETYLGQPFYTSSEAMGCVYAEPTNRYDNHDEALRHCREIFGEGAQLAEILSAEDQNTVNEVMLEAEATITEDPTYLLVHWFDRH